MKKLIQENLIKSIEELYEFDFDVKDVEVMRPKEERFGDFTTNIAMVLASRLKKNPVKIAEEIKLQATSYKLQALDKIEVVKPGYINFYLSKEYFQKKVEEIIEKKEKYGKQPNKGISINNEFISANPTGPLHVGNGRGGFYGDVLSKVLKKAGYQVTNEYYVNDAGEQIIKLGHSVLKDEEAVYAGEYIDELNKRIPEIKEKLGDKADDVKEIGWKASDLIMEEIIKPFVKDGMKIETMNYVHEKGLYMQEAINGNSFVDEALNILKTKGLTFEEDGAIWLRTTDFGDDKDRVLEKKDGNKTYFASDCGYLLYKIKNAKDFDKIIEIWGADHHGYIKRFEAAARALGFEGEIKFIILQLVRLIKNGKEVRMSKRAGNVVYVSDLIDEVGHDAARFIFLMYSPDTHMDFDLGLAKEKSAKNPVYYVQYAHARICSVIDKFANSNLQKENKSQTSDLSLLTHSKEVSLIRELDKFPELIDEISQTYEVHKLPHYAIELADKFHSFYNECQIVDENNPELSGARLELIKAVKIVMKEVLDLIGVEAPDNM